MAIGHSWRSSDSVAPRRGNRLHQTLEKLSARVLGKTYLDEIVVSKVRSTLELLVN